MKVDNYTKKLKKIDTVGIVIRPDSGDYIKNYYNIIDKKLSKKGVKRVLSYNSAKILGIDGGVEFDEMCKESDIIISLGGDGTLISISRRSYKFDKPILGINAGKLGFLVDVDIDEIESFLDKLFRGEYRIDKRMVFEVNFYKDDSKKSVIAFNDIVFSRSMVAGMVELKAYVDGVHFNNYYGDGLIISTPTGSTAYNLSSGGPVVFPLTQAVILTPLCSHSLTQRPLILPADFKVEIKSSDKVLVSVDGQEFFDMKEYDRVEIKVAKRGVKLIHRLERNYFNVLKEKLNWGDA